MKQAKAYVAALFQHLSLAASPPLLLQGTVSILAHSLGSVLCYDILCCQPPRGPRLPLPGSSTPPSPTQAQQGQRGQQTPRGSEGGEDSMVIDLTVDSPTGWLQQELSRLRAENQRLQQQLEVARAEGPSGAAGSSGIGTLQQQQQQQQQQGQAGVGAAVTGADGGRSARWPQLQFRWAANNEGSGECLAVILCSLLLRTALA